MACLDFISASDPGAFMVSCVKTTSLSRLRKWLAAQKFGCASMDAREISDKASLLCSLGNALKADELPEGSEWKSWDGAADYAWQSLVGQRRSHFALLILNADVLLGNHFSLLLQALQLLIEVGDQTETYKPHPVRLRVVFVGEGSQFAELKDDPQ
jgi:hypothetical protein